MSRSHPTSKDESDDEFGWKQIECNFTPAWLAVNMGTGILSTLLFILPYGAQWLSITAIIIFGINVILLIDFLIMNMLRYLLYPHLWVLTVGHPTEFISLGTFPVGLATIINMICLVCVPLLGDSVAYLAWVLWIFDSVILVLMTIVSPFMMMDGGYRSEFPLMTVEWILRIVSCVVVASSGAVVAEVLPDTQTAYWTVLMSYGLWVIGVALALMAITTSLQRLMAQKIYSREALRSPLGQGGFGIQKLSIISQKLFPQKEALDDFVGTIFYEFGLLIALLVWAFGLMWLFFATVTVIKTRRIPFNLGQWALTFPLGVFANCTCLMGDELGSDLFWVFGTILLLLVWVNWMLVGLFTLKAAIGGDIVVSQWAVRGKKKRKNVEFPLPPSLTG